MNERKKAYLRLLPVFVLFAVLCIAAWLHKPQDTSLSERRPLAQFPEITVENVLEGEPDMTATIVEQVNDPRFQLCLDIGHANSEVSDVPVEQWVRRWAGQLGHVHIHNNEGGWDTHSGLGEGSIPMEQTLKLLEELAPEATWTLETLEAEPSCRWLAERGWLEE